MGLSRDREIVDITSLFFSRLATPLRTGMHVRDCLDMWFFETSRRRDTFPSFLKIQGDWMEIATTRTHKLVTALQRPRAPGRPARHPA